MKKAKRLRRTWPEKIFMTLGVFLSAAMIVVGYGFLSFQQGFQDIIRIDGKGVLTEIEEPEIDPINVLMVGVDNAQGVQEGDSILTGRNTSSMLTDSILIVRIDPQQKSMRLLSIPRDLWVELGDGGRSEKINAAVAFGGPMLLIETIQKTLNIPIHHYSQVNFQAFQNVVDAIGGVPLEFDEPVRDPTTGLIVENAGCVTFDGKQSLALTRSRSYEALIDGKWVTDTSGDIGRVQRQQIFMKAALKKALLSTGRNPLEVQRLFNAVKSEIVLDNEISTQTILGLTSRLQNFSVTELETFTVPGIPGNEGAAWVLYFDEEEAQPILSRFREGEILPLPEPEDPPPEIIFFAPRPAESSNC